MNNRRPNRPDAILSMDRFTRVGIQVPFIEIIKVDDYLSILVGDACGDVQEFTLSKQQMAHLKKSL